MENDEGIIDGSGQRRKWKDIKEKLTEKREVVVDVKNPGLVLQDISRHIQEYGRDPA